MTRYICFCILPCLLLASPAAAQTCLGAPSFTDRAATQLGFLGAYSDDVQTAGITAMAGGNSGFGGVGYEFSDARDSLDPSGQVHGHDVYGRGGRELRASRVAVCPMGEFHAVFIPEVGGFKRFRIRGFQTFGGAQVGVIVVDTSAVQVIPTIGGGVVYDRSTLTNVNTDAADTTSETSGRLQVGVGVIFNQRIAITPMFRVPLGGDDDPDDPDGVEFRIMATFGFGG